MGRSGDSMGRDSLRDAPTGTTFADAEAPVAQWRPGFALRKSGRVRRRVAIFRACSPGILAVTSRSLSVDIWLLFLKRIHAYRNVMIKNDILRHLPESGWRYRWPRLQGGWRQYEATSGYREKIIILQ